MYIDNLETMLQKRQDNGNNVLPMYYEEKPRFSIAPQKAEKSASLENLIDMIAMLVSKIMKKEKVEFCPDEGARKSLDMAETLEHPYIFFEVIERSSKLERKPRLRENIFENDQNTDNLKRQGRIWGIRQKSLIQFNILACDYRQANTVMNIFEELIFNYTAYFKKNGIAEILFEKQFTDTNLDPYRQHVSVRSLQYYVEIEKLYTEFVSELEAVTLE